ncbi:zinc ribbon domain-containing protein [Nocardia pseudovaccinii]|uniref:zinc ribbon domain-containing protein n=1 Tax=Nocardia pseudovaccinii TaxID=189540 RepID=UPI003D942891
MKLVVQVKLLPDAATASALRETLTLCNRAANQVSRAAFTTGTTGMQALQRLTYTAVKQLGVSAQPALQCIRKTAGAYATLRANSAAGNYGSAGSNRRERVEAEPIRFGKDAAQPFDDRRAGIPVAHVDPRYTSQQCSRCGHTSRKNRPDQATFVCTSCGFAEHADVNAARNIAARADAGWAVSHAADDAAEPTPARRE